MNWHSLRLQLPPSAKILYREVRARLLDPFEVGTPAVVSGQTVRVPAYFRGGGRADYENAAVARMVRWLEAHPAGELVDCGCSLSVYSLIALSRFPDSAALGIDPDLVSLKCTRRLCALVPAPERLRLVHGFLDPLHGSARSLDAAAAATAAALDDPAVPGVTEAIGYREITDPGFAAVPRHSLDGLLAAADPQRPRLLKIDVEGFELSVLRGAAGVLRRLRPAILLSAHPQFHARLGTSPEALHAYLREAGYRNEWIATDHEEHWWCTAA
jgi:FkbM family methyltransferase